MTQPYGSTALAYLENGFAPLPLPPGKKTPPPEGFTGADGRWPAQRWVEVQVSRSPMANIGLRLPKRVVGLDIDQHPAEGKFGGDTLALLEARLGPLPATWRSSGRPVDPISGIRLFRLPDGVDEASLADPGEHIETIRYGHRYMVANPSIHPITGQPYRWYAPGPGMRLSIAGLPELPGSWVAHLQTQRTAPSSAGGPVVAMSQLSTERRAAVGPWAVAALSGIERDLIAARSWPDGFRDELGRGWEKLTADLFVRAHRIFDTLEAVAPDLRSAWAPRLQGAAPTSPSWTTRDVAAKWASQQRAAHKMGPISLESVGDRAEARAREAEMFADFPPADPSSPAPVAAAKKRAWNDFGNADRIIDRHGARMRFVPAGGDQGYWTVFQGGRWVRDGIEDGLTAAGEVLRKALWDETDLYDATPGSGPSATDTKPSSQQDDYKKWVATQQFSAKVAAAVKAVSMRTEMRALAAQFDRPPMLLNCANGIIDLRTGELGEHDSALLLSQQAPVAYDPGAQAPTWERFLATVMPDPAMREYLQRIVGYSLTADTSEQVLFIHHGTTKNGKSVFLDIMASLLGSYAQSVPQGVLTTTKNEQHSTGVARMEGKRFFQLSETRRGDRLDEQLIKRLSGGDVVAARLMRENDREFKIVGKFHLVTNHLPHIEHDEATMRRLRLVHWAVQIPEELRDPRLTEKLRGELPGILAWAVRGAVRWLEQGLGEPAQAMMDTAAYIQDQDVFMRWLEDYSVVGKDGGFVSTQELYDGYKGWALRGGLTQMTVIGFARELSRRGLLRNQLSTGERVRGYQVVWNPPVLNANWP